MQDTCILTLPCSEYWNLPSHNWRLKLGEDDAVKGFSEDICQLILCINWINLDHFVCNMSSEVVIFDCYVFCARCKLWAFCNSDAAVVILECLAMKFRSWVVEWECVAYFYHEIHKWNHYLHSLR